MPVPLISNPGSTFKFCVAIDICKLPAVPPEAKVPKVIISEVTLI
jgi:hypothetical protein